VAVNNELTAQIKTTAVNIDIVILFLFTL